MHWLMYVVIFIFIPFVNECFEARKEAPQYWRMTELNDSTLQPPFFELDGDIIVIADTTKYWKQRISVPYKKD